MNTGICWLEIFWEMLQHCMDYPWHSQKWQCSTFPKLGTSQIASTWFWNFIFLKTASAYALRQHSSCQSFGPKSSHDFMSGDFVENVRQMLESLSIIIWCTTQAAKTSAQRSGHDFLSGDFVENVQQVLEILSIILKCTIWAAKNSAQRFGHDFLSGDFVENVRQVLESLLIILRCTTQAAKTSAQNSSHDFLSRDFVENVWQVLEILSIILKCTTCKTFTLQGETHRHQGKPDWIYTGAYTKVQMSSLSKNRLKCRYICWHHQRVMPNNYKYPRGVT